MSHPKLLEPKEAVLGRDLLLSYIGYKLHPSIGLGKEMTGDKRKDYDTIAKRVYEFDSYASMPKDCKSFVSRCAANKKEHPSWTFLQVINHEYMKVEQQAERLYDAVKECALEYYRNVTYPETILPQMEEEWYLWAEKNPTLAYIEN